MALIMETQNLISKNTEETKVFGRHWAKHLKGGDILCFFGDLGSGKTTLIKGIAEGLKIDQNKVSSPTFVLMNVYEGRLTLFHFDFYRLENIREIDSIGYDEFLYGNGISVIEWADRLGASLPGEYLKVEMEHRALEERSIRLTAVGPRYQGLMGKIAQTQSQPRT
jgi:tRNA threonylcarbamoyladenosine biosynthesis protein TsaE